MKKVKENLYKKNTKEVYKKIDKLEKRLRLSKHYNLSKILKNLKSFFYDFLLLYDSMRKINDFDFLNYNGKYYKFIYYYQIEDYMRKSKKTISKKLNVLVTLGLIEKLDLYNKNISLNPIVKKALKKAKADGKRSVNFYHVPNYTYKLLKYSDNIAKQLLDNKFAIKNFNKSFVIIIFGQEFANKVFLDKRTIPKKYEQLTSNIEQTIIQIIKQQKIIKSKDLEFYLFQNIVYPKSYSQNDIKFNINLIVNKLIKEKIIIKRKLTIKEKELYHVEKYDKYVYILKGDK